MQTIIFLLSLITLLWSATALTVLTYNIQSGSGMDHVYNLTRTANAINAVTPQVDIVTLQEVDNKTKRHPDDQMNVLSTLTKLPNVAYAPFRDGFQGGQYGIGILSRFPILDMKIIKYQAPLGASNSLKDNTCAVSHDKDYCQGILLITIKHPTLGNLFIGTTHIGLGIEANELVELVENVKPFKPLIITGDFNSTPDSAAMATIYKHSDLVDSWQAVSKDDGFTFNSSTPTKRIDYVLTRGISAVQATVIDTQASDHRPLLVQF